MGGVSKDLGVSPADFDAIMDGICWRKFGIGDIGGVLDICIGEVVSWAR